ncbi:unnamed protein product [Adineta steineri]|uniref:CSD domain-containing protein n=1 Tax=Adineta steineri TaxID=433720 RepID=A0A814ALL7_9BILA|nr:unnamed protein product [Adineta steineri]CAF4228832.1 unnamed protein product [Adineta steineri]
MLSSIYVHLMRSVRPIHNYQQHFLRLLSTAEPNLSQTMSNNRETGVVKRFSKDKGYGFITKNSDGTDCFVHFKSINAVGFKLLEQGQEVEFTAVQGDKGLEARDVNVVNGGGGRSSFIPGSSPKSTSSRYGFGNPSRNQSSSAFNYGGNTSSDLHSIEQDSTPNERSYDFSGGFNNSNSENLFSSRRTQTDSRKRETGSVKRWTEERGFGFIRRSNGGPDLFCHTRSLKDGLRSLDEGQLVEFRIQRTDKGEEARDVSIFNEDSPSNQRQETTSNPDERYTGTVRKWIGEKGFGFITRDNGDSDVFVHIRNLSDGTMQLEEGQQVEFNIVSNEKGETAQNVTVCNEN